jgi:hypothetical protein
MTALVAGKRYVARQPAHCPPNSEVFNIPTEAGSRGLQPFAFVLTLAFRPQFWRSSVASPLSGLAGLSKHKAIEHEQFQWK